ncbi:methyltransferase family protein [Prosthecobacter fusiformis]|uniref:Methyltransferase family protein n=1 Tax=Prosthecobacter fusiformis TaxID=48464 RepID=A0A4R7SRA4_9BACT|nr:class I SAM-dependent methyltransferase [Prosthecobacter fusiformis]TDU81129.1 methyltransferase family protein [Prosthecobacter fusiformis]
MPTDHRDWYDTPLYYDIIFDADTPREATFLEMVWTIFGDKSRTRRVLEPACGSGRLVIEMARRGWDVAGFDGNEKMLDFAKERLRKNDLKARLWPDWMQNFTLPKTAHYDLAHCLVSTFKYLQTEADAMACLQRVAAVLKPGGIFVLGLHLSQYAKGKEEHERWKATRNDIEVVCNTHTWPPNRKTRLEDLRTRLKITHAGRTRIQETRWQFRTYDARQLKALLRKVPEFTLQICYDFTYDLDSPRKLDDSYPDIILVLKRVQYSSLSE